MDRKKDAIKWVLSLLLLLLLFYRLAPVLQNPKAYWSYYKWDWAPMGWPPEMFLVMLITLAAQLAAICIVQLGPFLALIFSILANWIKPPANRNIRILCIFACCIVFMGEGFFAFVGWISGSLHRWEMPWVNLAAALLNLTGLLLTSNHPKQD